MNLSIKRLGLALLLSLPMLENSYSMDPWEALGAGITKEVKELPKSKDFSGFKVAVIDNGFVIEHGGLKDHLGMGYNGRDGNFDINASIVGDFAHHERGRTASHGTHVAGILAQLLPHLKIIPIKRGSSGHRSVRSDISCLEFLSGKKDVQVVNMSFGMAWDDMIPPIIKLAKEGKIITISAGNRIGIFDDCIVKDRFIVSQGKMLSKILEELNGNVVIVGATQTDVMRVEKLASYSYKPSKEIEPFFISAPGSEILSCVPESTEQCGMKEYSGTSMASPMFAGALSFLATKFGVSAKEARDALFKTARKIKTVSTDPTNTGQGIIDFKAAYDLLARQVKEQPLLIDPIPVSPFGDLNQKKPVLSVFENLEEPKKGEGLPGKLPSSPATVEKFPYTQQFAYWGRTFAPEKKEEGPKVIPQIPPYFLLPTQQEKKEVPGVKVELPKPLENKIMVPFSPFARMIPLMPEKKPFDHTLTYETRMAAAEGLQKIEESERPKYCVVPGIDFGFLICKVEDRESFLKETFRDYGHAQEFLTRLGEDQLNYYISFELPSWKILKRIVVQPMKKAPVYDPFAILAPQREDPKPPVKVISPDVLEKQIREIKVKTYHSLEVAQQALTEIDPSVRSKYCILPDTYWDVYSITETSNKTFFLEEDFSSQGLAIEFLKKFVEIYPEENQKYECFKTMFSNGYRLRLKKAVVPVVLQPTGDVPVLKVPEEVVQKPVEFFGFKVPTADFPLQVKQPELRLEEILAKRYLTPEDAKENLMKIEEKERIKYCVLPNSHSGYSIKDLSQKYSFLDTLFAKDLDAFVFLLNFSKLYPEESQKYEWYQSKTEDGCRIRRKNVVKEPVVEVPTKVVSPSIMIQEVVGQNYATALDARKDLMKIDERVRVKYCVVPNVLGNFTIKAESEKYYFLKEEFGELQARDFLVNFSKLYPEEGQKFECYQLMRSHGYGIRRKEVAKEPILSFVPQPTRDAPILKEKEDDILERKPILDLSVLKDPIKESPKAPVKLEVPLEQEDTVVKKARVEQKIKLPEPQRKEEFQKKYFDSYKEAFQFWFKIDEAERFDYRIEHETKNGYCVIKVK